MGNPLSAPSSLPDPLIIEIDKPDQMQNASKASLVFLYESKDDQKMSKYLKISVSYASNVSIVDVMGRVPVPHFGLLLENKFRVDDEKEYKYCLAHALREQKSKVKFEFFFTNDESYWKKRLARFVGGSSKNVSVTYKGKATGTGEDIKRCVEEELVKPFVLKSGYAKIALNETSTLSNCVLCAHRLAAVLLRRELDPFLGEWIDSNRGRLIRGSDVPVDRIEGGVPCRLTDKWEDVQVSEDGKVRIQRRAKEPSPGPASVHAEPYRVIVRDPASDRHFLPTQHAWRDVARGKVWEKIKIEYNRYIDGAWREDPSFGGLVVRNADR
jgi:hypothetical protein